MSVDSLLPWTQYEVIIILIHLQDLSQFQNSFVLTSIYVQYRTKVSKTKYMTKPHEKVHPTTSYSMIERMVQDWISFSMQAEMIQKRRQRNTIEIHKELWIPVFQRHTLLMCTRIFDWNKEHFHCEQFLRQANMWVYVSRMRCWNIGIHNSLWVSIVFRCLLFCIISACVENEIQYWTFLSIVE